MSGRRRILALGGGGLGEGGRDTALDQYVLTLVDSPDPKICLLPTASGDPEDQIRRFYMAFGPRRCHPSHLSLFRLGKQPRSIAEYLLAQDIIYVGGGSLLNLLAIWRTHGVDETVRTAWEQGIVLAGVSAGSMCWFEAGITSSHGAPEPAAALGLLPGSNCVHYDGEPARRPRYHEALLSGMPAGYGVDDGVALLFEGRRLSCAVSARPEARAYRVGVADGEIEETPIEVKRLTEEVPAAALSIEEFRAARIERVGSNRPGIRWANLFD